MSNQNSYTDTNFYRLQPFSIPTKGKNSIAYVCAIIDLPLLYDANANLIPYEFSTPTYGNDSDGNLTLFITVNQPSGSVIQSMIECTTFGAPFFFKQQGVVNNTLVNLSFESIEISGTLTDEIGGEIPIKSKSTPTKTSSLYDPDNYSSEPFYAIRSSYLNLNTASPTNYTLNNPGAFLLLYCKAASAADAPISRALYAIINGDTVYCTTVPLVPVPQSYTTKNVVAAHYLKCDQIGIFQNAIFEGLDTPYPIPQS